MDTIELLNRFEYHAPDEVKVRRHEIIRNDIKLVATLWNEGLPEGREKSIAITKLEEAMFWANASLARN